MAARAEAGFEPMETYIQRRQNPVTQYISPRFLMYLCEESERKQGARVEVWWREQAGIDLAGARETAAVEADEGLKWNTTRAGEMLVGTK